MSETEQSALTLNTYEFVHYHKDPWWVRSLRALVGRDLMPMAHAGRKEKDRWTMKNLVVDEGLDELLTQTFKNGTQSTTWYLGLTDGTPSAASGDTMASHPGWTEVTAYTEANRVTWQSGTVSGGSLDNSANKATFSINANSTVTGGAFLTDNNTKGGATGKLYAAGAFSGGDKTLDDQETIDVTATMSVT